MALKRINKVRLLFTAHRLAICQPQKAIEKFSYALPCVCVRVCVHECEKLRNSVGIVPRRLCRNCCDVGRPLGRLLCANDSSPEWLAFHEWTPKGWGLPSVPENKCRKVDDRVWMFEKSLKKWQFTHLRDKLSWNTLTGQASESDFDLIEIVINMRPYAFAADINTFLDCDLRHHAAHWLARLIRRLRLTSLRSRWTWLLYSGTQSKRVDYLA